EEQGRAFKQARRHIPCQVRINRTDFGGRASGGIAWANGEWLNLLLRRSLYFLRKRSSRTTSPPPAGLSGCASDVVAAGSGLAGGGTAPVHPAPALGPPRAPPPP